MGKLVEQTLRTMYQGVSRQPHTVRLPGQVQEATNAMFSVVSGGFSKRPGTQHLATLSLSPSLMGLYGYERDASEKYLVLVTNGSIDVYDSEGIAKTVTIESGSTYLQSLDPSQDFAFTTVADYTFVVNKTVTVTMSSAGVFDPATMPHVLVRNADGTFTFKEFDEYNDRPEIEPDYYVNPNVTYSLTDDAGGRFDIDSGTGLVTVKDSTLLNVTAETSFDITAKATSTDGTFNTKTFTIYAYPSSIGELVDDDSSLDSTNVNGMVYDNASNGDLVGLTVFAEDRVTNSEPTTPIPAEDIIPTPDFVNHTISDITFFRNRLGLVSDETVYFSQASDYTNFWPKTVAQVIDSDPFGRTASSAQINMLRFVVPFRKALFCSADTAQFELSAEQALTPSSTTIGLSTQYASEPKCRPLGFRDELYFASSNGDNAALFEYYYSDTSVGHTANNVLIHADGYVPSPIVKLTGDTVSGTIFAYSTTNANCIYVYSTFWNGEEKAQSSWSRWEFDDNVVVLNMEVIGGELYVLLQRSNIVTLEKCSLNISNKPAKFKYPLRLDGLQLLNGTFDSATGLTTYTSDYPANADLVAITDTEDSPTSKQGKVLNISTVSGNDFTVIGDYSDSPTFVGRPYDMNVELSKQFLREGDSNDTVTTGRLQLKRIYFDYQESAFLQVVVHPLHRSPKVYTFNGSVIGSVISTAPELGDGVFAAPVRSDGSTATISIQNPSHLPCTITSAKWKGFFNETTRQE